MKKAVRQNKNAKVLLISEDEQIKEGFKNKFKELIILNDKLFCKKSKALSAALL